MTSDCLGRGLWFQIVTLNKSLSLSRTIKWKGTKAEVHYIILKKEG